MDHSVEVVKQLDTYYNRHQASSVLISKLIPSSGDIMKWTKYLGEPALAFTNKDLDIVRSLFSEAARLWERDGTYTDKFKGSVVIGAGIGVLYLAPRCRKPKELCVIRSPFQSDGGGSVCIPLNYLARHGIAAFHMYGIID